MECYKSLDEIRLFRNKIVHQDSNYSYTDADAARALNAANDLLNQVFRLKLSINLGLSLGGLWTVATADRDTCVFRDFESRHLEIKFDLLVFNQWSFNSAARDRWNYNFDRADRFEKWNELVEIRDIHFEMFCELLSEQNELTTF